MTRRAGRGFVGLALALSACTAEPAAGDTDALSLAGPLTARTERGCYELELRAEPAAPATGELFAIATTVRDGETGAPLPGARVALDATMPHHAHGMTTRPVHTSLGGGRHRTEGMRLHMPGRWALEVRVEGPCADGATLTIEQPPAHSSRGR